MASKKPSSSKAAKKGATGKKKSLRVSKASLRDLDTPADKALKGGGSWSGIFRTN